MKQILISLPLLLCLSFFAFAGADDITVDRPTNVFTTQVSVSSSAAPAVRVGLNGSIPAVVFNRGGQTPVVLGSAAGKLTLNGVAITTDTIAGDDLTAIDDVIVGDDLVVSGAAAISETLAVNGVATVGKLDTGYGENELFDMDQHVLTTSAVSFTGLTNLGKMKLYSRTMAELLLISPAAVGEVYFCSNCTPAKAVVSTGTAAGNFSDAVGGAFQ